MMLFRVGASAAGFGVRGGAFSHPIAFGVQQHILCSRSSRRYFGRKSYILRCSAGGTGADTTSEAAEPRTIGSSPTRLGASVEYRPYKTLVPAAERLVVVGDVHGDIAAFRKCLRMANLVDTSDRWAGGDTVLVQLGDIFDRGDDDLRIEEWVYHLAQEAERANGAVYSIMGNHEVLNALGDHSMATLKSFKPFNDLQPELDKLVGGDWGELEGFPPWARCRILAMRAGGPTAKLMASHAVCMKVGDNLFVHGGLTAKHLDGDGTGVEKTEGDGDAAAVSGAEAAMEDINAKVSAWMLEGNTSVPRIIWGEDSPVWLRTFSSPDSRDMTAAPRTELEKVLRLTGTKRMLVGHTPQRAGINSAADGQIWRLDTGMTAMIGGRPEALEIRGEDITVLTENGSIPGSRRACPPISSPSEAQELPIP